MKPLSRMQLWGLGLLALTLCIVPCYAEILGETFTDREGHFKVSTPNGDWHFLPRGVDPGPLRLTIRYKHKLYDFVPNVTITVTDLAEEEKDLSGFLDRQLQGLPKTLEVLSKKKSTHHQLDMYEVVLFNAETDLIFHQAFLKIDHHALIMTGTCKKASYTRMREDFDAIFSSLVLIQ